MRALLKLGGQRFERVAPRAGKRDAAPCACSARAIAPPSPPDAPVTSAVFPVRSNTSVVPLARICQGFAEALKAATSAGAPTLIAVAPRRCA